MRIGIVGSGFGGRVLLPCLSAVNGLRVVAFCSRQSGLMKPQLDPYGITRVFSSLEAMLDWGGLDGVCVATPPFLHASMALQVLTNGKHLLCEKPMALNFFEAQEMLMTAEKTESLHFINHQLRFHPQCRKIKAMLTRGALGQIYHVELSYMTATRVDPRQPWDWWSDKEKGGGQLNALGSHWVDMLRWWFGEIQWAQAHGKTFTQRRPLGAQMLAVSSDEFVTFHLGFDNNAIASVVLSCVAADNKGIFVRITGSHGILLMEGFNRLVHVKKDAGIEDISEPDDLLGRSIIGVNSWRTSMVRFGRHLAAVSGGKAVGEAATFVDGLQVQKVLDALHLSCEQGRRIDIASMGLAEIR